VLGRGGEKLPPSFLRIPSHDLIIVQLHGWNVLASIQLNVWRCMRPLPRPLQALVTWAVILPLVLGVSALTAPVTVGWPDPARTALVITIVVPLAVFWAVPLLARTVQRLRGTPTAVIAASCPAPGMTGQASPATSACSTDPGDISGRGHGVRR
jgi:hypothetical protein